MATVGENRPLRDRFNTLNRELRELQTRYNTQRPLAGQDFETDQATFRAISEQTNKVLFSMEELQKQNASDPNLFDPTLAQAIEKSTVGGREVITNSERVLQISRQAQNEVTAERAAATQGPRTSSAGDVVGGAAAARDSGANTQNPPLPEQQAGAEGQVESAVTRTPSNAQPATVASVPAASAAPPTLPPSTTTVPQSPQAINTAVPSQSIGQLEPGPLNNTTQSYIFKTVEVTHNFDRGRFTQDLVGRLLVFPYPTSAAQSDTRNGAVSRTDQIEYDPQDQSAAETRRLQGNAGDLAAANRRFEIPSVASASGMSQPQTQGNQPVSAAAAVVAPAQNSGPTSGGQSVALRNQSIEQALEAARAAARTAQNLVKD